MRATFVLTCLCAMLAACGGGSPDFRPVMIPVPAGEGSGEPHLAVTRDGMAVLSWLEPGEGGHALRYARLGQDGWSPAATVARGEHWSVNWADFPSVVPLSDTLWAAHWLVRQPAGGYAYDVMMSLSTDSGATWGEPLSPHSDGTPTEHGFVTLFPWQGGAGVAWLDGRNTVEAGPDAGHEHGHGEAGMTLRAAVLAPDGSRSSEAVVDGLTCDCCQTDVAIGDRGPVLVYRDRTEQEIRDIRAVLASGEGWQPPVPVATDGWQIDGCPVNGPAVAASGRTVVVAWFTASEGRPQVRMARSTDGGASFGDPVDVDTEAPLGRVDIELLPDGDAVISWLRPTEQGGTAIAIRRVPVDGAPGPVRDVALTTSGRAGGFPQMVMASGRLVLAWTEADDRGTRVRGAVVDPAQL
jgi:hypothetical protein